MITLRQITPSLWLTLSLCAVLLLLGCFAAITEPALQFDRTLIAAEQWWRLFSGQFIHYGSYHLFMNVAALLLVGFILLRNISLFIYLELLATTLTAVGLGLYINNSELSYYAGLSGVLHGLIVAGLLLTLVETPMFNGLALFAVAGKLLQEQSASFDVNHPLLPVPVAVDAHVYGALAGLVFGCVILALSLRKKNPIDHTNNWK